MRRAVAHVKSNSGLLHDGTWVDGRNQAEELWRDKASVVPSDRAAAYLVYALLGMIASLPFAAPWDGETRIYAATLPLFFLLPAYGVGGLYLMIATRFHKAIPESQTDFDPKIAVGTALTIGGLLSIGVISTSLCLIGNGSTPKDRRQPVRLMMDELT